MYSFGAQTDIRFDDQNNLADFEAAGIDAATLQMTSFDDIGESKYDPMYWDPSMDRPDNAMRLKMAPTGYDIYDPPERVANRRGYLASFGFDDAFMSPFGPAAIIG